jgi:NADH dehydrogenase/NADH:ubiquinone oxidoreductase subunit G
MVILFFKKLFFRGALTSKPYAFLARPWEFKSVDSIDVFDSLASNIRIDIRGDKILRILPRANDSINED